MVVYPYQGNYRKSNPRRSARGENLLAITVLERTRVSVGKKVIGYEGLVL